jgi:D-alanyl-D-alanine dipeptidase
MEDLEGNLFRKLSAGRSARPLHPFTKQAHSGENARMIQKILIVLSVVLILSGARAAPAPGFVDLATIHPGIKIEMRYFSVWNFMGRIIPGYKANRCFLTREAATALAKAQEALTKKGYSLLVLDCYRPARAVQAFVNWTRDEKDQKMKSVFYTDEPKATLIDRGYIADRSGHSRGSTVDLTLIKKTVAKSGKEIPLRFKESGGDCRDTRGIESTGQLDMGTAYDCFSELANTDHPRVGIQAKSNRKILLDAMESAGFQNYPKEWWHFTLKNEPFSDQYFDFEVE